MPLNQLPGDQIKDESVTGDDILDGSLTGDDILDGSITADDLAPGVGGSGGSAVVYAFDFTLTGTNQDTWTGTRTQAGMASSDSVVPAVKNALGGTFIITVTATRAGEFDWKLESFQGFTGGVVKISYVVG